MKYSSSKEERASLTDNLIHLIRSKKKKKKKKKLKKPSDLKRIRSKLLYYISIDNDPELRIFKDLGKFCKKEQFNDKENVSFKRKSINQEELINPSHKRKINTKETKEIEKRNKLESVIKMYDYRPAAASIKNDSEYITKSEEDEENLINAFYQQRFLGGSNNSIATLCNIGNSCYLNSVIYTLRFAPKFLHKLHHLCDDLQYVYQKIGQNKHKSSSLGRNVSGLQVSHVSSHTN